MAPDDNAGLLLLVRKHEGFFGVCNVGEGCLAVRAVTTERVVNFCLKRIQFLTTASLPPVSCLLFPLSPTRLPSIAVQSFTVALSTARPWMLYWLREWRRSQSRLGSAASRDHVILTTCSCFHVPSGDRIPVCTGLGGHGLVKKVKQGC